MKPIPPLESRIQRIAEQYGDGLLRIYATEAGEVVAERDRLRLRLRVLSLMYYLILGTAAGCSLVNLARYMGWL